MMEHLTTVLTKLHSLSRPYSPIPILKRLRVVGKQFHLGRQEDSHEFLRCLLEAVDRQELRVSSTGHAAASVVCLFVLFFSQRT